MSITIYHNPACGTSRNVLAMIRNSGEEPRVIEYLKTPPSRDELVDLITRAKLTPRELLRRKGTPHDQLGLGDPALTDDQLIDAMMAHPILINRPLVVTSRRRRRSTTRLPNSGRTMTICCSSSSTRLSSPSPNQSAPASPAPIKKSASQPPLVKSVQPKRPTTSRLTAVSGK